MVDKIRALIDKILAALHLIKFKEIIMYLIVGTLTTGVDWVVFFVFSKFVPPLFTDTFICKITPNVLAYSIAWLCSVIFCYIMSKLFVFKETGEHVSTQFAKFFWTRFLTLVLSILIGDVLLYGDYAIVQLKSVYLAKLIASVVVVIVNYITNKFLVFALSKRQKAKMEKEKSEEKESN